VLAALGVGISVYEKHITINKKLPGPDHRASLNKIEFINLIKKIRNVESAIGDGVKRVMPCEIKNVKKLKKFLVAKKDIQKGKKITSDDITTKRTGGLGLSASKYFKILNKKSWKEFKINQPITK